MVDPFQSYGDGIAAPASRVAPVTPHDSDAITRVGKALYVGTGGTVVLRAVNDGADTTWRNVPDGAVLPVRAAYVRATGTTAADILSLG